MFFQEAIWALRPVEAALSYRFPNIVRAPEARHTFTRNLHQYPLARKQSESSSPLLRPLLCTKLSLQLRGTQTMRIALNTVAGLLLLAGVVWFLQGINVLPGSFMTGQIHGRFTVVSPLLRASVCF